MLLFIEGVGLVGSDVIAGVVPGVAGVGMVGVGSVIVDAVGVVIMLMSYSVYVITIDGVYVTV